MANSYFQFKKFTINQEKCGMPVNTDSVLLGAWANVDNCNKILDIGTGTGILSLMMAQRCNATIDAVEIDEASYLQALTNFEQSDWGDRINAYFCSIQEFAASTSSKYELLICNPPYFANAVKSTNHQKKTARHTDTLSFENLISATMHLLEDKGRLSLILPYSEGCIFIALAAKEGLFCVRKTNVKSVTHAPITRLLLEFATLPQQVAEDYLVIADEQNNYSDKFRHLTVDFYKFF
ncbi:MAG TPA: methyltransferase [Bacteroidales bacterium]|nr:methyltransferase [Bacteroidales bacterium]